MHVIYPIRLIVFHMSTCLPQGLLKIHLPSSAFLNCSLDKNEHNTLFEKVASSNNIKFEDMKTYFELILGFYQHLSPEGNSPAT